MIEEVLEILQRQIFFSCHVNNQPGWVGDRAKLGQGYAQQLCFPFFNATISMKCMFRLMIVSA
jgi:hypothetical protein